MMMGSTFLPIVTRKTQKQILVLSGNKDLLNQTVLKALILLAVGRRAAAKRGF